MKPDFMELARSIARQIEASRDQVRMLTQHWPTDGSHREGIVRKILRERLPPRCSVESGFVVTPNDQSRQIDLLIVDRDKPTVARGEDGTIFVTPDAVLGMIEVKSRLEGPSDYQTALMQLCDSAKLCPNLLWTGLFVMDGGREQSFFDGPDDTILAALKSASVETGVRAHSVCVGSDLFVRYWSDSATQAAGIHQGPAWHTYFLCELAPGYFIGNFVAELTSMPGENDRIWFPMPDGKEVMRRWFCPVDGHPQLFPEYRNSSEINGIKAVLRRAEKWREG